MKSVRAVIVFAVSAPVFFASLLGCSKDEACTKTRLEAADAWKGVYEQAGKMKLSGGPSFEELSQDKQAEHTKQLAVLEAQSEMVFKSFAYEKITWKTANPARDKALATWEGYFNKGQYPMFAGTLKAANAQYDAVKMACGEE
jgi:hypothetical protein